MVQQTASFGLRGSRIETCNVSPGFSLAKRVSLLQCLLCHAFRFSQGRVVHTIRYVPQVNGDSMVSSGPIDLDSLVDLDSLAACGTSHWTFLAFPAHTVNEHGVPSDPDAQRYIAAVQSVGVPVGIWCNSPVDGTAYAAVARNTIPQLHAALENLNQFHDSYAADLSERLFRESSPGGT